MIPEDLSTLTDDELQALADDVRAQAEGLAADAATSDEALTALEALVADMERVNGELAGRKAKAEERAQRAADALAKLSGAEVGDAEVGEPEGEIEVEEMPEEIMLSEDEPVTTEVTDAAEFSAQDDAPADEPVAEADEAVAEASIDGEEVAEMAAQDDTPEEVVTEADTTEVFAEDDDATGRDGEAEASAEEITASTEDAEEFDAGADGSDDEVTEATASDQAEFTAQEVEVNDNGSDTDTGAEALSRLVPDGVAPQPEVASVGAPLVASNAVPGLAEGTTLDRASLATAIAKKRHGMNNASAGSYERIVLATAQSDMPNKVSGGAEENFAVFDRVATEWRQSRKQQTALVASGGNCAPLEPSYEFFRLAEPLNPVESALPTVEAPRGGIRFITPPDWRDAFAGVRVTTEAEDAAGYGPGYTEPKPCVHVDCPPVEECRVDAVSQCVEFGNLNYRVFPEQVEAFLQDLAVAFSSTKEVFYLDAIDGASTAVTATPAYGATRGITQTILAAAANYRRRQHMPIDSVLTIMLPSWVVEFVKVDMVNDHSMGLGFLNAGEAEVNAWLASANLDVAWYYDSATGAGQGFADVQGAGAINPFPTSVVGYLFAPGTFVRLDGGTLDVGIVRDSILNGTNDLQIFSEQWVQVCQVGLESLRLEITLCPDGTGPEPVTPLVCGD